MIVAHNPFSISTYFGVQKASDRLYTSMRKLSSGERIGRPGDAPSDLGISEKLRYQIRNGESALRNIENARYLVGASDQWLDTSSQILRRMSEVAVAAIDSSKSDEDRANLEADFQQLRSELGRISRQARYNGIQVAGHDQMVAYDQDLETFVFSQIDGHESYRLDRKVMNGLEADNSLDFLYDATKPFIQSGDGQHIFYADANNNLVKYDIEGGNLYRDTSSTDARGFDVDEEGRLWVATETAPASGVYELAEQDVATWTQDTTLLGVGQINDMASPEFAIHEDRVYYLNTAGDIVSRNLHNTEDIEISLTPFEVPFSTTDGQYAISEEGLYLADLSAPGILRITNMEEKTSTTLALPAGVTVDNLAFSVDSSELFYRDTATNDIRKVVVDRGETPALRDEGILHSSSGAAGFAGLSVDGGSHRAHFRVHSGPDSTQESFLTTGDVRLNMLGLSRVSVLNIEDAEHALGKVSNALEKVTVQRATLGAGAARLDYSHYALTRYMDEVFAADNLIRSVDIAKETAEMTKYQVQHQAALSLLAQANQMPQSVLPLLARG